MDKKKWMEEAIEFMLQDEQLAAEQERAECMANHPAGKGKRG